MDQEKAPCLVWSDRAEEVARMFRFQNIKDIMSPLMMQRQRSTNFLADERESGQVCGSTLYFATQITKKYCTTMCQCPIVCTLIYVPANQPREWYRLGLHMSEQAASAKARKRSLGASPLISKSIQTSLAFRCLGNQNAISMFQNYFTNTIRKYLFSD